MTGMTSAPPPKGRPGDAHGPGRGAAERASSGHRLTDVVVPALDAIVEGSWIALVYVSLQLGPAHGAAVLGLLAFVVAAAVGVAWARWADGATRRGSPAWATWVLALVAGAAGWLADPAARAALASALAGGAAFADLEAAISANIAGWLLGLAVLRGATHGPGSLDDERIGAMLDRILLLAIPWALGLAFARDDRPAFVAAALVATLTFVGAALLAVGLARLESLGTEAGVDWRRNRAWVVIVGGVIVAILAVSVPAALLTGAPPGTLLDAMWAPFAAVAGLLGLVTAAVAAPILGGLEAVLRVLPTPGPTRSPVPIPPLDSGAGTVAAAQADPRVGLTIAILALVAISIAVVLLVARPAARRRRDRATGPGPAAPEERAIVLPRGLLHVPALRLRARRRSSPTTAAEAYLALLDDVADDAVLARRPNESPRAHARRIRSLGVLAPDEPGSARGAPTAVDHDPGADLALLVADWELARYAGRTLSAAEDRRGVSRWWRLRAIVGRGSRGRRRTAGDGTR